jgi:hypothetical protein
MSESRDPRPAYILHDCRKLADYREVLEASNELLGEYRAEGNDENIVMMEKYIVALKAGIKGLEDHLGFFDYPLREEDR